MSRTLEVVVQALALAAVLAACGGGGGGSAPASPAAATDGQAEAMLYAQTITVAGIERRYHVFVPALDASQRGSAAVVLAFHGNGGSADQMLGIGVNAAPFRRWIDIARSERIVLIVPDGTFGSDGSRGWNDCRSDATTNPGTDDVALVDALLDRAVARYGAAATKAFATGISNGGLFSFRLAVERPDRIAAIAPVAAAMAARSKCAPPTQPVGVLIINGTADPIRPDEGGAVTGGNRGTQLSSDATLALWRQVDGVSAPTSTVPVPDVYGGDGCTAVRIGVPGAGWPAVELLRIVGGGHTEPSRTDRYGGAYQPLVGAQNGDVEMADEVWRFFVSQRR